MTKRSTHWHASRLQSVLRHLDELAFEINFTVQRCEHQPLVVHADAGTNVAVQRNQCDLFEGQFGNKD